MPSLRLMPTPTFCMEAMEAMVWDMPDMVLATTARGLLMLMLSPRLSPRLMLIPTTMVDTTDMVWDTTAMDTVLDTEDTMVTVWDTTAMDMDTMARGLLTP